MQPVVFAQNLKEIDTFRNIKRRRHLGLGVRTHSITTADYDDVITRADSPVCGRRASVVV